MRRCSQRRPGLMALDALLVTAVTVVLAAAVYAAVRHHLTGFSFVLGTVVGGPVP
jgi:hypothetical protein